MSDEKPPEPISDEAINSIVTVVESAELLAGIFNVSVSTAVRMMLKSAQISTRLQNEKNINFSTAFGKSLPERKMW